MKAQVVSRNIVPVAVALAIVISVSSCVGAPGVQQPTNAPQGMPTPDASDSPTSDAALEAQLVPGGTAAQNKKFFDLTNQNYFIAAGNVIPEGRGVIDNLVAAGFDKSLMQVTPDRTAIDLPVDSLVFSVLFGDECMIGQFSPFGYSTIIAPKLTTGSCLVGVTRAIDW